MTVQPIYFTDGETEDQRGGPKISAWAALLGRNLPSQVLLSPAPGLGPAQQFKPDLTGGTSEAWRQLGLGWPPSKS